jgi:hypothetical protein
VVRSALSQEVEDPVSNCHSDQDAKDVLDVFEVVAPALPVAARPRVPIARVAKLTADAVTEANAADEAKADMAASVATTTACAIARPLRVRRARH